MLRRKTNKQNAKPPKPKKQSKTNFGGGWKKARGIQLTIKRRRKGSKEEVKLLSVSGLEEVFSDKRFSSLSLHTSVDGELITCWVRLFH